MQGMESAIRVTSALSDVVHPVSRQEPVFAQLEYLLRMSLNSVSACIYRLYAIKNPHEIEDFKHKTKGYFVDVWFNLNSEKMKDYSVVSIATQGFEVPQTGITVKTGTIFLDKSTMQDHTLTQNDIVNSSLTGTRRRKVFKLLHCLVAPGRCFFASNKLTEVVVPKGYDSIYIQPGKL
jgi:hypothetical protein